MSSCPSHDDGEHNFWYRYTTSPTGNDWKKGNVLVDKCRCGQVKPVHPENLSYHQKLWIDRFNARTERYWNEQGK